MSKPPQKQPALHMMIGDYFKDPLLGQASLVSRAVWYELLMFMWEGDRRGEIVTTPVRLMGLVRCRDILEILHFINEINDIEFGYIEFENGIDFPVTEADCNEKVTLRNRRMYAEFKNRQNTRLRVEKHRKNKSVTPKKRKGNADVTPSSSVSSSVSITKKVSLKEDTLCPHQKIIEIYHQKLPMLPIVQNHSKELATRLRVRWREDPDRQNLEWWEWYFDGVSKCDFLVGKVKDWAASFSWLIRPKNMTKVLNGEYVNRNKGTKTDRAIEEFLNET